MRKALVVIVTLALVALGAGVSVGGEYHAGNTNFCSDCHTMHFSMNHGFAAGGAITPGTPAAGGDWLGTTGPNAFLLKAPANELCLACHNGQTFAPDVLAANTNGGATNREAGALNDLTGAAPYDTWKGHTLGSTVNPPGFNPVLLGLTANWYDPAKGLECISCHSQHGSAASYRNLGPYALGTTAPYRPTYVLGSTNDTTLDVWINVSGYISGSSAPATFNPFYDSANVSFNRVDNTVNSMKTSNRIDNLCGACHADFHGGPGDANIGATSAALDGFIRHPSSQVTIGAAGTQGFGGHSSLSRFVANTTKVKVYANDRTGFTDATPGCVSCHKSHGNQNPFGLVFLNRSAASVNEEGGFASGQTADLTTGYRNLCGQCHSQGN
jgi:hypothetical protein